MGGDSMYQVTTSKEGQSDIILNDVLVGHVRVDYDSRNYVWTVRKPSGHVLLIGQEPFGPDKKWNATYFTRALDTCLKYVKKTYGD